MTNRRTAMRSARLAMVMGEDNRWRSGGKFGRRNDLREAEKRRERAFLTTEDTEKHGRLGLGILTKGSKGSEGLGLCSL